MKIFVTGATGFVGSAVVAELLRAGHHVTGLARSQQNADALKKAGAAVHQGSLQDLESLRSGAGASDGVIHCAFNHDMTRFAENAQDEKRAVEALGSGVAGSQRLLLVTSGVAMLAPGRIATEDTVRGPEMKFPRDPELVMALPSVRASCIRLSPAVHGKGDTHGFTPTFINLAKKTGVSAYPGDGTNVWPAAHVLDAAVLYRLTIEKDLAGVRLHAVAEGGVATKDIAKAIGERWKLPVESRPPEHFGPFANFAAINQQAANEKTQASTGWKPTQPGLLADLTANYP